MKRTSFRPRLAILLACLAGTVAYAFHDCIASRPAVTQRTATADGTRQIEMLSSTYLLDRVYKSMSGPRSNHARIRLSETATARDTLWLTGLRAEVVDARSHETLSPEFFCHSNLTFNPETTSPAQHNAAFNPARHMDWRIFTLVPGMMDVKLPPGFGIPIRGDTLVDHFTMSLNQNPGQPVRKVQMRSQIDFTENGKGMKPLFRRALYVYQQHQEKPTPETTAASSHAGEHQGATCGEACNRNQKGGTASTFANLFKTDGGNVHPGTSCCVQNASRDGVMPQFGGENTVHWMVPPGIHRYRTEVTQQMNLPESTTAHYANGHLHPFGRSLDLVDMDTGKTVFHVTAEEYKDRLGVSKMTAISLPQGVSLEKTTVTNW